MRLSQLKRRLRSLKTRYDADTLAADLGRISERCDGTLAEQFIAGWVNACVMIDEGYPDAATDEIFVHFCMAEVDNMGMLK